MINEKHPLSWRDVDNLCYDIQRNIRYTQDMTNACIVGIKRGGLIPGVILSHDLSLPLEVINYQRLDGNYKGLSKEELEPILKYDNIFVVDDIYDTGITLEEIMLALNSHITVSQCVECYALQVKIKHKENFSSLSPCYINETQWAGDDKWVVFPWEQE